MSKEKKPVYTVRPLLVGDIRAINDNPSLSVGQRNLMVAQRRILKDGQAMTDQEFDEMNFDEFDRLTEEINKMDSEKAVKKS